MKSARLLIYSGVIILLLFLVEQVLDSRTLSSFPTLDAEKILPPQVSADNDATPTLLTINSINLTAPIASLGQTADGRPEVPPDDKTASWWALGAKPGDKGSAVIAGHFRVESGGPGVFFNLNKVKVGDEVVITTADTTQKTFVVKRIEIFAEREFPLKEIYGANDKSHLNLVTCSGTFLKEKSDYSHRLVVYTEPK